MSKQPLLTNFFLLSDVNDDESRFKIKIAIHILPVKLFRLVNKPQAIVSFLAFQISSLFQIRTLPSLCAMFPEIQGKINQLCFLLKNKKCPFF